ncbi:hypothetical protein SAMN05421810_10798 [Amycolatopsis arida]|uniref:Uncharacterized protein n=1 Tax=Amycolatopsis arida TaxID=587909 RepID=A0A1I5YEA2_9PSEU|nr:hypothetical protein [Amycolatopsis arida]TDX90454.1 hypothetical protein CLV69_10798 [Amycolatopsis arida]SFQ42528.1 hypothetical protein SAMN05421810_10798 [Amycolatopsis arida]
MSLRAEHLRRLLDAGPDARLVLQEGRYEVTDGETAGALSVVTRAGLLDRLGGERPDEGRLEEQAAMLETEISNLGA